MNVNLPSGWSGLAVVLVFLAAVVVWRGPDWFPLLEDGRESHSEATVKEAVEKYYMSVEREDWDYTYYNLDSYTQDLFSREEWHQKNQYDADKNGLSLLTMHVGVLHLDTDGGLAEVNVYREFTNNVTIDRRTIFVEEDGIWKHRFTEEERDLFMPGVPYEQFVERNAG